MKLVPGKKYTREQMQRFMTAARAEKLKLKGYVLRHDIMDGTYSVVPWTEAGGAEDFGPLSPKVTQTGLRAPRMGQAEFAPIDPIRKRTPAERKASLVSRWWEQCQKAGTVPGLTDEQVTAILGEDWKTGTSVMTGETVEKLATVMLGKAEQTRKVDDYSKF